VKYYVADNTAHVLVKYELDDPFIAAREPVAKSLKKDTHDLSEFLLDVMSIEDVGAYFPHRVTYHSTCHSRRGLELGERPYRLLRAVRGLTLLDLANSEECCGFGGTFSVKNPDVSIAMGADKARHVGETGAEVLVAADRSCLMHVGGLLSRQRSGVRVMHLAEVLASTEGGRR
jgi:L-lactate dehydrogenase complex protein LldE